MKWIGHSDYKAMRPYIDIAEKTKSDAMKHQTYSNFVNTVYDFQDTTPVTHKFFLSWSHYLILMRIPDANACIGHWLADSIISVLGPI